jgi:hypothetical protein
MSHRVSCRSREELLAWLDGELSRWTRFQISRHLRGCWECRNRAADLTDTIRIAASAVATPPPQRTQVSKAKWRFYEKTREYEAALDPAPAGSKLRRRLLAGAAATAAIAAVFAMPAIVQRRPSAPAPVPAAPRPKPATQPRHMEPPAAATVVLPAVRPLTAEAPMPPAAPRLPLVERLVVDPRALDQVEVAVWSVLHRSRLCLSGEIAVRRTERAIEVSGMAANEDRKNQLLALFSAVRRQDLLQTQVQTVPEAPLPARPFAPATAGASEAPAENWLRARMRVGDAATQREMFDVMNGIVSNAQGLLAEAWAVRRLAERFPAATETALAEPERMELRAMAEDHAIAAQAHIGAIGELLRRLGIQFPSGSASRAPDDWQSGALPLQRRAAESARALLTLFTAGSEAAPAIAGDAEIMRAVAGLSEARELVARERERLGPLLESALKHP